MSWPQSLIGKKFVSGGRGPDEFDCWGLLRWVYDKHWGISLPEYGGILPGTPDATRAIAHGAEMGEWHESKQAVDGCAVGLSKHKIFHHVGVFTALDGGLVVHAYDQTGVVAQSLQSLKMNGWRRIAFFRHTLTINREP